MRKEFKVIVTEEDGGEVLEPYINGPDWKQVVWDFDQFLRLKLKYSELPEREAEFYEEVRTKLFELICEYDLTLG